MDQSQVFSRRAYVFEKNIEVTSAEIKLIQDIFMSLDTPIKIDSVKPIKSTPSFDVYKASSSRKHYIIKLSFADSCPEIFRENKNLASANSLVLPKSVACGTFEIGDKIHYAINSCEQANRVREVGRGVLMDNFNSFIESYKKLQASPKPEERLRDLLGGFFKLQNLEDNFLSTSIEAIEEHSDRARLQELLKDIENYVSSIYSVDIFEKNWFCHGNLNLENIIFRGVTFKMIDLEFAHRGNPLFDLANLVLATGVSGNNKIQSIKRFCKELKINYNISEYNACERMASAMLLYRLAIDYMYEVYMFDSSRELNICQIISDYSQNFRVFCNLPFFGKYKSFISKTVTEPIVGISADK